MQVTYYGRFHGPQTGRVYAEIYKSSKDDGLTLDERVEARRFWTLWGAKRWIDKTILKPNNLTQPLSRLQFINTLK